MTRPLINKTDRICVMGSTGMAGRAISRALSRSGYVNQFAPSRKEVDLLISDDVERWFQNNLPDVVVLAAARVGGIHANNTYPADFLLENLKIQNNVIETSWRCGVRRLLFLGSSCIYPKFSDQPIIEEELLRGSLEPTNQWYAIAKIAGIKLCDSLRIQEGFDAISLMPTNLYGPGDNYHPENSHVLPALIRRFHEKKLNKESSVICWGSGTPLRELLHVDDLGEACVFVLKNWNPSSMEAPCDKNGDPLGFLNVGTGKDLSISQIAEEVAKTIGFHGEILWDTSKADGTPKKQLDISRIKKLGWAPQIELGHGIKMAYEDFLRSIGEGNLRS